MEHQVVDKPGEIEAIPGDKRVLLVAPHGFMGDGNGMEADDVRTGQIARELALKFGFYAVINEKYKRAESLQKSDKNRGLIDCGRIDQVKLVADEFLDPIFSLKEKILQEHGNPLVIFVHGVDDKSVEAYIEDFKKNHGIDILVGYGQGNGQESKTATAELLADFKKALEAVDRVMTAEEAEPGSNYCGADKNNLSQIFRQQEYCDPRVQSLQLEINKALRTQGKIKETIQVLGAALSKLVQNNMPALVENAPDLVLVDRAHHELVGIFTGHFESAMKEAGRYLIDQFYGGDIQRARDNKPVKGQSLYQLITRLNQQENGPRKSWIYNSVAMAVQDSDFSGFHTYGKIGLSHKVLLLRVHDRAQKEKLIEETAREALPVIRLREKIAELKNSSQPNSPAPKGLMTVISKPEVLFSKEKSPITEVEELKGLDIKALDNLLARAQSEKSEIETKIREMEEHVRNYGRLIGRIAAAKEHKSKESAKHVSSPMKGVATWLEEVPRIISVSRKTDIPAYYGGWFMDRLRQGYSGYINSIVKSERYLVSLKPEHVICFVFWSKNFGPFVESLREIRDRGYGCLLHFTITGLPKEFEPNVPDSESAIITIKELSRLFSSDNVFWRYDPIVISDVTDENYHLKRFEWISSQLEGPVSRCYFSFPTHYKKVSRGIKKFKDEHGIAIYDPDKDFKVSLANRLAEIAGQHGMTMHSCAGEYLVGGKIEKAHCVDGDLIDSLFSPTPAKRQRKEKPMREGCGCARSTDIGIYDSCIHSCVYCYANMNKERAVLSYRRHDPGSTFLGYSKEESEKWTRKVDTQDSPTKGKIRNPEMSDRGKNWNVVTGCDKFSEGCLNCYAEDIVKWQTGLDRPHYQDNGFNLTLRHDRLDWPIKKLPKHPKRPFRSFVTDMGDLFHQKVPDEFIHQVFETLLKVPQHRFYVLTKRSERLKELGPRLPWKPWIWAGVTVESNKHLDRIDHLKELPPEVHKFLMLEPLLSEMPELDLKGIDWVIVGGETSKKKRFRPMKEEWVIGIRDQVKKAGIPFMFKHRPGRNHNQTEALLEGKRWEEFPESILSNVARNVVSASEQTVKDLGVTIGDKHAFAYEAKTGIAETEPFQKKQLADLACNIGNICIFGCTYCYVPSIVRKNPYVNSILGRGFSFDHVSNYRSKENVIERVEKDLKKIKSGDKRVVIFCTTCEPCATKEHTDITAEAIRLIMTRSDLQVRVLSKSVLILEIAKALDLYRDRIIYSLSTGTVRPDISACIEGNASPIQERLKILHVLQDGGYRTYGMLCPILPSEMPHLGELIDAVNPKSCEHVWAEAINLRGKSLVKTRDQLRKCALEDDAESLQKVVGNKDRWREYCKELFLKVRRELEERGFRDKLRFLQYVVGEPEDFRRFFESQKGAVCL